MRDNPHFRLIICAHDLAETPVASGDELTCWMPMSRFRPWIGAVRDAAHKNGIAVEITTDDAFASDYTALLPYLLETGQTATFFVPTAFIGRPGRLSVGQLRELHGLGMHIGTHGTNHVPWAKISIDAAREDIHASIATLEDLIGTRVSSAAPPFGNYDHRIVALLAAYGISDIHTCDGGFAHDAGRLRSRVAISADDTVNSGILGLAARPPGGRDLLRAQWHRLRALSRRVGGQIPRRRAAESSAAA